MGRGIVLGLVLAAALSGCGDATGREGVSPEPAPPAASPTAMLPADGPVRTVATVLDEADGPMLCLGGVAQSLPPQCAGPDVLGWSWDEHPDHEAVGGVTWGEYTMVGDWDGVAFTPSEARATIPEDWSTDDEATIFASRCEEPAGGWAPIDPTTTNRAALSAGHRVVEKLPDYAMSWGDQSINPRWDDWQDLVDGGGSSIEVEMAMNDPVFTILNVAVTEDLERAEAAVRTVWGGALCVTRFANTQDRLHQVARELRDLPGGLGGGYGSISNTVEISVVHDDGSIQAWVDEEYGEGVVTVTSALTPVG